MDGLTLIVREPDKAYVADMLWLPKSKIAEVAIKQALEFWDIEKGKAVMRRLWEETRDHLLCPREFLRPDQYSDFPFPFIDLNQKLFPKTNLWAKNEPRDAGQQRAWEALDKTHGGILNLSCGKGKTYLSLKKAAQLGCPTLVVVHNSYLMNQWLEEAIPTHVELPPGQKVGVIQGPQFEWKHPVVVAMIHTLASKVDAGEIPEGFRDWFGCVIYDEVHHLSAPVFVKTAPLVRGVRLGLTATDLRADGTDFIYKFHIGEIFYSDLSQELIPRVYFQQTPVYVDLKAPEVRDIKGELSIPKLRTFVGDHDVSNNFRAHCIREALKEDRKILCVSHSKNQLKNLHEMFPDSGLIVRETDPKERSAIVRNSKITFAIASLGFEGLDDPSIDTIFVLLPFKQPHDLQQVMGRAQRAKEGKKQPVLIIFDDIRVKPFHGLCHQLRAILKNWEHHSKGHMKAISYTILQPPPT